MTWSGCHGVSTFSVAYSPEYMFTAKHAATEFFTCLFFAQCTTLCVVGPYHGKTGPLPPALFSSTSASRDCARTAPNVAASLSQLRQRKGKSQEWHAGSTTQRLASSVTSLRHAGTLTCTFPYEDWPSWRRCLIGARACKIPFCAISSRRTMANCRWGPIRKIT